MGMATSERQPRHHVKTVEPASTDEAWDRVRHVDELSGPALEQFLTLLDGGTTIDTDRDGDLAPGDVIVFTEYYRITAS